MDPEFKLAVFAAVLSLGTGVIWWRLVILILRGCVSTDAAETADPTPQGDRPSRS